MNNSAFIFANQARGTDNFYLYVFIFFLLAFSIGFGLLCTLCAYFFYSRKKVKQSSKYYWLLFAICSISYLIVSGLIC